MKLGLMTGLYHPREIIPQAAVEACKMFLTQYIGQ